MVYDFISYYIIGISQAAGCGPLRLRAADRLLRLAPVAGLLPQPCRGSVHLSVYDYVSLSLSLSLSV